MKNLIYFYYVNLLFLTVFLFTVFIKINYSNKFIIFCTFVFFFIYFLSDYNLNYRFFAYTNENVIAIKIKKLLIILFLTFFLINNLIEVAILLLIFDYIVKLTFESSVIEMFYNSEISLRGSDES